MGTIYYNTMFMDLTSVRTTASYLNEGLVAAAFKVFLLEVIIQKGYLV